MITLGLITKTFLEVARDDLLNQRAASAERKLYRAFRSLHDAFNLQKGHHGDMLLIDHNFPNRTLDNLPELALFVLDDLEKKGWPLLNSSDPELEPPHLFRNIEFMLAHVRNKSEFDFRLDLNADEAEEKKFKWGNSNKPYSDFIQAHISDIQQIADAVRDLKPENIKTFRDTYRPRLQI